MLKPTTHIQRREAKFYMAEQFSYTQFEQHRIKFVAINHCCWEKSIRVTVLLNCIEEVKKKNEHRISGKCYSQIE